MTPPRRTRDQLLEAIEQLPEAYLPPACVVDSEETDTPDASFCLEHADVVARGDAIITGCEMFILNISGGETDGTHFCAFHGCGQELDGGGLTDYGVDSALALTETNPFECRVTAHELRRSALALGPDDPRWETWERQVRRVLAKRSGSRRWAA